MRQITDYIILLNGQNWFLIFLCNRVAILRIIS